MKLENKLGKSFDSLTQRILYAYVASYPDYKPANLGVSDKSQKQMHDFIAGILLELYNKPEILGVADEPDACYENWAMNNSNPALIKSMEKIENKFAGLIEILIKIGQLGEIDQNRMIIRKEKWSIPKPIISKLEKLGVICEQSKDQAVLSVEKYPEIFPAWKTYAESDDSNAALISRAIAFIHGRYGDKKYSAVDFFGDLIDNANLLEKLENYLAENHFSFANFDINNKTRFAYVKWLKDYPNKETAYMKAFLDWRKKDQMVFEFRLPQFRIMLNSYDKMNADLQKFVFGRLKTCDNCGYCTQTDKSGKRSCLALDLSCDGETLNKCPLYPYLTWNYLSEYDLNNILQLFEFSESVL